MWEPFAPFHPFLHTPGFPRLENRDKSIQTGRCFKTCSSQTFRKQRRDISSGISHWIWSQCWNSAVTGALLAFPIPGILTPAPISQRFPVQEGAGHPWEGGSALQEGWKWDWDWDWDHSGSSQVLPDPPGSASLGLIPGFGGLESCAELVGGGFKLFQQEKFSSINEKENNPCPSPSLLNQCRNLPKSKENWGNQLEICWDFRDGRGSSQIPGLDRHLLTLGPYPGPAAPAAPCSGIPAVPGTGKIRIGKQPGWSWGNFRMQKKKLSKDASPIPIPFPSSLLSPSAPSISCLETTVGFFWDIPSQEILSMPGMSWEVLPCPQHRAGPGQKLGTALAESQRAEKSMELAGKTQEFS